MPSELSPYEFFRSIGSPQLVVAPMVEHSELAYRLLTRRYGAQLVYTQMYNANAFVNSNEWMDDIVEVKEDRPLIVQFAGHDPQVMLQAAKYVENHCDAVDVNLGCPQGIAKRGRYGAFLMEELDLLAEIVSTLKNGLKIPVTCKTRIYTDFDRTVKLCETLVNAGASMLCIHGRTREQKGHLVGEADWNTLARLKKHFGNRVPIIANGGVRCVDDIYRCIQETGVDGVMTSEAILENPALFSKNIHPETGLFRNQLDLTEEYLDLVTTYPAPHMRCVRSHVMKFLYRYCHVHTNVRDMIGTANTIDEFKRVLQICREIVADNETSYQNIWYDRYRDEEKERVLKETHNSKNVRTANNLIDNDNGCADMFGAFEMFTEE